MPCTSDYLNPTHREVELQHTAMLYAYALKENGDPVPAKVKASAKDIYCKNDFVAHLCALIRSMDPAVREAIVYNARIEKSRQLASWWERHEQADNARHKAESEERKLKKKQNQVLAKARKHLTEEEIELLKSAD